MGAFELGSKSSASNCGCGSGGSTNSADTFNGGANLDPNRIREENIIAFKIYDSCRQQDCLNGSSLGPALSAVEMNEEGYTLNCGDVVRPPTGTASVQVENVRVKSICVIDKEPNPFRSGFWDVNVKYVFEYKLIFRDCGGCMIMWLMAESVYIKKLTLFGSNSSDIVSGSDLFSTIGMGSSTLGSDPYIWVDAKAGGCECPQPPAFLHYSICSQSISANVFLPNPKSYPIFSNASI